MRHEGGLGNGAGRGTFGDRLAFLPLIGLSFDRHRPAAAGGRHRNLGEIHRTSAPMVLGFLAIRALAGRTVGRCVERFPEQAGNIGVEDRGPIR